MKRTAVLALLAVIMILAVTSGCADEIVPPDLQMIWGIADEVKGFEGLQREPEGIVVEYVDEDTLQVTWRVGARYVLPISAVADKELEGVRYFGTGIPDSWQVEWLDPRARQWYALDEIPAEMIVLAVEEQNGSFSIDFGPPQGADFAEGMYRVIWFRITPAEADAYGFQIFGYLPAEAEAPADRRVVSNILNLLAEVQP